MTPDRLGFLTTDVGDAPRREEAARPATGCGVRQCNCKALRVHLPNW
jgi:hypothetical protein